MGLSVKKFQRLRLTEATQLTNGLSNHTDPRWSPDGSRLTFCAEGGGDIQIYACDRQGRLARQITTGQGVHREAAWSPDGRTIAYSWRKTDAGRWQIWLSDLIDPSATRVLLSSTRFNYLHPSWSPDGKSLVFASTQGASDKAHNLWRLDLASGDKVQLTADTERHDAEPHYYHSGRTLLFKGSTSKKPDLPQLYKIDLETLVTERVTKGSKPIGGATFVDESLILYERHSPRRGSDIRALNLNSGESIRLIPGAGGARSWVDAKGGISMAWHAAPTDGAPSEIHIATLEGYKASKTVRFEPPGRNKE